LALVERLRANAHGSVFDTITRKTFDQFLVLSAPSEVLKKFGKMTSPIFERMKTADLESKTLSELRDTLLPKLISGELRIPDAEKFLEEAGI
jgi:type I restriction enzyme S subunit